MLHTQHQKRRIYAGRLLVISKKDKVSKYMTKKIATFGLFFVIV